MNRKTRSGLTIDGFSLTVKKDFDVERVSDLLAQAFEVGSNYWYQGLDIERLPNGYTAKDVKADGRLQPDNAYWHWSSIVPLLSGGAVTFTLGDESPWEPGKAPPTCPPNCKFDPKSGVYNIRLDREAIERGLRVFIDKYPNAYADWLEENDDAETGDIFLQCCAFGEVIFG